MGQKIISPLNKNDIILLNYYHSINNNNDNDESVIKYLRSVSEKTWSLYGPDRMIFFAMF